jgi:hypothetical protein
MHAHAYKNKLRQFKQRLSAWQKADGNCFCGGKWVLLVEFTQQGTIVTEEVYVLPNNKKLRTAHMNLLSEQASYIRIIQNITFSVIVIITNRYT